MRIYTLIGHFCIDTKVKECKNAIELAMANSIAFYFMNKVVYIDLNIECFWLKTVSYLFLREAVY